MAKKITFTTQEEKDEAIEEFKEKVSEKDTWFADHLTALENAQVVPS